MFSLFCEYLWLYINYSNPFSILCNCLEKSLSLWLRSLLLCVWATCNLVLHFSGTLLGSAKGTGLLPVCGRNLYNCLCSLFLYSIILYPLHKTLNSIRLWTSFRLWTWEQFLNVKEEVLKHTIQPPPFLWFFSPLDISCFLDKLNNQLAQNFRILLLKDWRKILH